MHPVLVQAVGVVATILVLISYQTKTSHTIVLLQFCAAALFALHYYLLGAMAGCLIGVVATVRNAVFSLSDRHRFAASLWWIPVFIGAGLGVYALSFTVFGTAWNVKNALIELLPFFGMSVQTVAMRLKNPQHVRVVNGASIPFWSSYNIIQGSVGGLCSDAVTLLSATVGYLRYRKKQTEPKTENPDKPVS